MADVKPELADYIKEYDDVRKSQGKKVLLKQNEGNEGSQKIR